MYPTIQMTLNNGYVMAVEDSLVQAKKLKNFLDMNNLKNAMFSNATDAFEAAVATPPLLIISDIVMPGMDGYEFCTKIKNQERLKDIPVILLTSLRDPLDIIKGLQAGADNFITKPYEDEYLLSRIQYLLANRDLRMSGSTGMVLEIMFRGNKYAINSEKKQILDLLLSVYEAAVQRNDQLISTQAELEASNENLLAANQELEAFAHTVSHDLRSPLNVVAGYTQLLLADYRNKLDAEAIEFLDRMLQSAFSMSKLIDDLLKFSRSGRSQIVPEYVDLTAIARKVTREVAEGSGSLKAEIIISEGLLTQADPSLMEVVLGNLIGNAVKYSGKVDHPVVRFDKRAEGRETVFFVSDNGAGFDMAKADKMFNPFQRFHSSSEFQGTGVGLATVKRIIERHGGRIWAESAPGQGATFFFTLGN